MPLRETLNKVQLRQLMYDAVIVTGSFALSTFAFPILQRPINNTATDPLSMYLNCILFSLIIFSIAFSCAVPVYSYFKETGSPSFFELLDKRLFYPLLLFILTIFTLATSILSLPQVSMIILFMSNTVFGFSLGIELRLEQDVDAFGRFEMQARKFYDRSIASHLPYFLCIMAIIVPVEIYLAQFNLGGIGTAIVALLLVPVYYAGTFLSNRVFHRFEITRGRGAVNFIAYNIVPFAVLIIFQLWEYSIIVSAYLPSDRDIFSFSFFFIITGLIPLRLLYVFEPGTSPVNRVICAAALAFYCFNKYTMIC